MHSVRMASCRALRVPPGRLSSPGTRALFSVPHLESRPSPLLHRVSAESPDDSDSRSGLGGRFWRYLSAKQSSRDGASRSSSAGSDSGGRGDSSDPAGSSLIPNSPEARYREVMAVPLLRRPLFPGGIMPVTVQSTALVRELLEIRKAGAQAYVGAFLTKGPHVASSELGEFPFLDNGVAEGEAGRPAEESEAGRSTEEGLNEDALPPPSSSTPPLSLANLHEIGTFAQVHTIVPHESGAQLLLLGHRRIRATGTTSADPLRLAVAHLRDEGYASSEDVSRATAMEMISTLKELLHLHPLYNEQMRNFIQFGADFHDLSRLADLAASLTTADAGALQQVLECLHVPERAQAALLLIKKEVELCRLQADIGKRVEEKISKDQRRYFLMEQYKSIKKELGLEKDEKTALVQRFRERLAPLLPEVPEEVRRVVDEELEKLQGIEPASSEFNVTRNYLDWLTSLPWGKYSEERLDIEAAQKVLDADHYGLVDVKERILEFIAVGKLRGHTQGKILCLVGPPGVGKTSVGRSISNALGRSYYRFSVGGLSDVAEIKGHRRTYVGAMPGKMVQCLKHTGVSNPLVLIDEIDKLGRGFQGDPASALLELLDPEQNASFLDHYLDLPYDLSKVLFVCTANVLDTIPPPLLDRMEVIRLSGYIFDEKVAIARRYLEPAAQRGCGVPPGAVTASDEALACLVDDYARESGVRNLKNQLEKLYRKAAFQLVQRGVSVPLAQQRALEAEVRKDVQGESRALEEGGCAAAVERGEAPAGSSELDSARGVTQTRLETEEAAGEAAYAEPLIAIGKADLATYLGPPPFTSDKIYAEGTPPGVVMGLAWTAMGGSTLYIEAASVERAEGKGSLRTTGQLGDVMKESAAIAHTYARAFWERGQAKMEKTGAVGKGGIAHVPSAAPLSPSLSQPCDRNFFAEHALHVHVPAGATPKDGPSAGCTMVTALLSLALGQPVRPDLAMTGEVTLTGKVLPVGGIKEKTLAARRAGVRHVVFPEDNRRDWDELTPETRMGLSPHFVRQYAEVFDVALGEGAAVGRQWDQAGAEVQT